MRPYARSVHHGGVRLLARYAAMCPARNSACRLIHAPFGYAPESNMTSVSRAGHLSTSDVCVTCKSVQKRRSNTVMTSPGATKNWGNTLPRTASPPIVRTIAA